MAGHRSFRGGVHPPERKALAADSAIEVMPTPDAVYLPLLQHIGAPSKPTVSPKDAVAIGDEVAEPGAFVSAGVHASIDGVASRPGFVTLPNGRHVPMVPLKRAEEQQLAGQPLFDALFGGDWPVDGIDDLWPEAILDAIRTAGIVGLGGAAFPTHVKLARNPEKPISTVLINGCECEPYLTTDYRLMLEVPAGIVAGALVAQRACGAERVIICIEDNKPRAVESLRAAAAGTAIEIHVLPTKYPQGGEKQLIVAVTGLKVPTGALPLDVGIVVLNVGTTAAIARAVLRKRPLTHHVISVTGDGIKTPKNIMVPIGIPFQNIIDYCGGLTPEAARVVAGGPMMGFTVGTLDAPVTKGTSGITVLTHDDIRRAAETSCVRCGRCVDVCPMGLVPTRIALAARAENNELAEQYHIMSCMECGSCAYVCPASLPLVQLIRVGKVRLRSDN